MGQEREQAAANQANKNRSQIALDITRFGSEWLDTYFDDDDPVVSKKHGINMTYFFHRNLADTLQKLA